MARGCGNLSDPIFKSSNARALPEGGGGVFKFRVDRRIIFFDLPISLCWMDMVVVHILSTAVDSIKEQRPKILFLFLSDQGWALIII